MWDLNVCVNVNVCVCVFVGQKGNRDENAANKVGSEQNEFKPWWVLN
jgi:hypothetical protein